MAVLRPNPWVRLITNPTMFRGLPRRLAARPVRDPTCPCLSLSSWSVAFSLMAVKLHFAAVSGTGTDGCWETTDPGQSGLQLPREDRTPSCEPTCSWRPSRNARVGPRLGGPDEETIMREPKSHASRERAKRQRARSRRNFQQALHGRQRLTTPADDERRAAERQAEDDRYRAMYEAIIARQNRPTDDT